MRGLLSAVATFAVFASRFLFVYGTEQPTVLLKPYWFGQIVSDGTEFFSAGESGALARGGYFDVGLIVPVLFLAVLYAFFYFLVFANVGARR